MQTKLSYFICMQQTECTKNYLKLRQYKFLKMVWNSWKFWDNFIPLFIYSFFVIIITLYLFELKYHTKDKVNSSDIYDGDIFELSLAWIYQDLLNLKFENLQNLILKLTSNSSADFHKLDHLSPLYLIGVTREPCKNLYFKNINFE